MTDIKIRARILMQGKICRVCIKSILPYLSWGLSLLVFLLPLFCVLYGTHRVFPRLSNKTAYFFAFLLFSVSVFLFLFAFIRKCYGNAAVYFSLDKNSPAPASYFRFSQGFRYLRMKILVMLYKSCWGCVFMFPGAFMFYVLTAGLIDGSMPRNVFITLFTAGVLMLLCGAVFFYTVSSRYFLCEYLFFLYPLSPAGSLVASSVLLSRKKLIYITRCRFSLLPWKLFGIFLFTLPFSRVFISFTKAVLAESIYGEKKCSTKKPAVVFYINRQSVFKPGMKNA